MTNIYRKSVFERGGKYKFLHLLVDDRPFASLVESAGQSSPLAMSCTPISAIPLRTKVKNPTEQDYSEERNRLEREGWEFRVESFDELPIGVASQLQLKGNRNGRL
jgi:hypothetical protein